MPAPDLERDPSTQNYNIIQAAAHRQPLTPTPDNTATMAPINKLGPVTCIVSCLIALQSAPALQIGPLFSSSRSGAVAGPSSSSTSDAQSQLRASEALLRSACGAGGGARRRGGGRGGDDNIALVPFVEALRGIAPVLGMLGAPIGPLAVKEVEKIAAKLEAAADGAASIDRPTTVSALLRHDRHSPSADASAVTSLTWAARVLEFAARIFGGEGSLAQAARESYRRVLRPHHDWVLRATFGGMLELVPADEQVLAPFSSSRAAQGAGVTSARADLARWAGAVQQCVAPAERLLLSAAR